MTLEKFWWNQEQQSVLVLCNDDNLHQRLGDCVQHDDGHSDTNA